ncbi:MAG: chromate transporter [Bacteroidaceae bacterium]|nr:chromate transporter [Bacteroidaceae bacterium]
MLTLFKVFWGIGLFTIGGGYAMIPLIEAKVVDEKQWISREELLDLMAVAQSCPGIFAVNIAIFIGYKIRGTWGALLSTLGCILPSFLIILAIALFFRQFQDNVWVARAFRGIRPCVVALIAAPTFKMAKTAQISRYNIWIPVLGAFLIWMFGVSPIWVIVAAGLGGYLYGKYIGTDSPPALPIREGADTFQEMNAESIESANSESIESTNADNPSEHSTPSLIGRARGESAL